MESVSLNDYLGLRTADGFLISRLTNLELLYSEREVLNVRLINDMCDVYGLFFMERFLNEFYYVQENLFNKARKGVNKELDIYNETERLYKIIQGKLKPLYEYCFSFSTIEASNRVFKKNLNIILDESFDLINPSLKPYVVYKIKDRYKEYL